MSILANLLANAGSGAIAGKEYVDRQRLLQAQQDEQRKYREAMLESQRRQTESALAKLAQDAEEAKRKAAEATERRGRLVKGLIARGVPADQAEAVADYPTAAADWLKPPDVPKATPKVEERDYRGGVAQFKDGAFEKWVIRPQAERDPSPVAGLMQEQRVFQREKGLKDDFSQDPNIKTARQLADAVTGIESAARGQTPADDLAMIYQMVKLLDPGSVVREGEINLTRAARSLGTQVTGYWSKLKSGKLLTPEERQNILGMSRRKVDSQRGLVDPILQSYGEQARRWGVDSASVAPDPFKGIPRSAMEKYGLTPLPSAKPKR